jgi:MAF protein
MFTRSGKDVTPPILASGSPRRRELIRLLDVPFEVVKPETIESTDRSFGARRMAMHLATMKAAAVAGRSKERVIVAADTLVLLGDEVMGKPQDAAAARGMLEDLRSGEHQVISGLAVIHPTASAPMVQAIETQVWMRRYDDEEISAYIQRGEPFDKAGAYAIQDLDFDPVERIEGCYANVMGLPLCHLYKMLRHVDLFLPAPPAQSCEDYIGRSCPVAEHILGSDSR